MKVRIPFPFGCAASAAVGVISLTAAEPVALTSPYINRLAEELRTNHPALGAANARARAAEANARSVRIWEDPMLRIGGMGAEEDMRAGEGDLLYGVEQRIPLFGRPQAVRRVAQADARVERADADLRFQTLRRDLAQSLFRTAYADSAVDIGRQDAQWLRLLADAAEARFRSGQSRLPELVLIQNELSSRTNELQTDMARRDDLRVALNRQLNRPLDTPWPELALPEPAVRVAFTEKLVELALRNEPHTKVLSERAGQAQAMVEVSQRERYPEVALDLEGRNYTGNGDFRQGMVMLKFSLPLGNYSNYRKSIEREQDRLAAARLDVADQHLALRRELHELTVTIDTARREALLYRDTLIPRTEQALSSARSDWETGNGDFRDVLDLRRMLLDARLKYARAVSEQWEALADLTLCCGLGDLEASSMIGVETGAPPSSATPPRNP
jgi:outer membrane protein TolC